MNKTPPSCATTSSRLTERLVFPIIAMLTALLLTYAPDLISPNLQLLGLAIMVMILGVPHGALDPWIAEQIGIVSTRQQSILFTLGYLALTAIVVIVWHWAPLASLVIFLLISAFHFSGDWAKDLSWLPRLTAGIILLLLPIGLQPDSVAAIFVHLSGDQAGTLADLLSLPPWLLAGAMAALIGWALWEKCWTVALEFVALFVLADASPPLVYFALYFCLLHSPRHLMGLFRQAGQSQRPRLIQMIVLYTLLTGILAGLLWWLWQDLSVDSLVLRLIFIGLAAVTVPHMILIAAAKASASTPHTSQ